MDTFGSPQLGDSSIRGGVRDVGLHGVVCDISPFSVEPQETSAGKFCSSSVLLLLGWLFFLILYILVWLCLNYTGTSSVGFVVAQFVRYWVSCSAGYVNHFKSLSVGGRHFTRHPQNSISLVQGLLNRERHSIQRIN